MCSSPLLLAELEGGAGKGRRCNSSRLSSLMEAPRLSEELWLDSEPSEERGEGVPFTARAWRPSSLESLRPRRERGAASPLLVSTFRPSREAEPLLEEDLEALGGV